MTFTKAYEKGYDTVINNLKTNLKGMKTNLKHEKSWFKKQKIKIEMESLDLVIMLASSLKPAFIKEFERELIDIN